MRIVVAVVMSTWCAMSFADGKVFKSVAEDPTAATMPDQQALIHFKDGVETLVIETRFTGTAANFAWVVPLPTAPEVTPATRGLFKTLRAMHQPRIVANHQGLEALWVALCIVLLVMIANPGRAVRIAVVTGVILLTVVLFLPSLGKARGGADGPSEDVTEVSRQIVGEFEVTVVESREPGAMVAWLKANGFGVPAGAEKVIAECVADGWVFAAAKMRRDAASAATGPITPHPLVFTFPVKSPVYPMRLTAVENGGPLAVDLYVLADGRAEAPGFTVERCAEVTYIPSLTTASRHWMETIQVSHGWLVEHAPGAKVATRLVGTLQPEQMTKDVDVRVVGFSGFARELWSSDAAWERAINMALGVCAAGLLVVLVVGRVRDWKGLRAGPVMAVAAMGLATAGVTYAATPLAGSVKSVRELRVDRIGYDLHEACEARVQQGKEIDEAWLREIARVLAQSEAFERDGTDANMPIEEDSPGNYGFRHDEYGWWFLYYDYHGRENAMTLTP